MIEIYTDGSGKGGWGAVIVYPDGHTEEIGGKISNPTNNRAEMVAIIESIKYINPKRIDKVRIYTDSAYISNCFRDKWYVKWERNGWTTSNNTEVKNRDLWEKLIYLIDPTTCKCDILKVQGHAGITYNERADALASEYNPKD